MKYIFYTIFCSFLFLTGCDLIQQCTNPCPEGQKKGFDCKCYGPGEEKQKFNITVSQDDLLLSIINKDEQKLNTLVVAVKPDNPLDLTSFANFEGFRNIYARNPDIFARLNYQRNNLTLLSLLAPLDNFNQAFGILLKNGANPNLQAFPGLTPLQIAIVANQGEKVDMLLKAGAEINLESDILLKLLNSGRYKSLKAVTNYAKEKEFVLILPPNYFVEAMMNNQTELANAVAPLTDKKVLNTPNNFGVLPLVQAAFLGDIKLIDTLLANGADLELRNEFARTPLLAYLQEIYIAQIEGNFPKGQESQITKIAAHLIEKGAVIDAKDIYGEDVLFYAIRDNNTPLTELLVTTYKYDVNTTNKKGETPLFVAAQNAPNLITFLLAQGANPAIKDKSGRSAAIAAAELGRMELYEMLEHAAATRI